MHQTVLVKLAPTADQHAAVVRTLEPFNAACNAVATVAFAEQCASTFARQKLVSYDSRQQFGLSAQMTIRARARVVEVDQRDRRSQPMLRPHGAMGFDERICRFPAADRVSLLTPDGRRDIPLRFGDYAAGMLTRKRGQADLLYRPGTCYLAVTVEAPEPGAHQPADFLGVDLGIISPAATSDGEFLHHSTGPKHAPINQVRARYSRFRQKLHKMGTKSSKRLLKQQRGQERRFSKEVNHGLSKAIVQTAKGTGRFVALEDLKTIRSRVTGSTRQRRVLHSWAFAPLRSFIAFKAALAGVALVLVNPAYASQTGSRCGHCAKANRPTQSRFFCTSCGCSAHADVNAAENIRRAAVMLPDAAALAGELQAPGFSHGVRDCHLLV
jgi:IS605 OrfB family transposase